MEYFQDFIFSKDRAVVTKGVSLHVMSYIAARGHTHPHTLTLSHTCHYFGIYIFQKEKIPNKFDKGLILYQQAVFPFKILKVCFLVLNNMLKIN